MQQREYVGQVQLEHRAVVARRYTQYVVQTLRDGQVFHVLLFCTCLECRSPISAAEIRIVRAT